MNNLEQELKKALNYITSDWKMQNNYQDYRSNFIYKVETVDECIELAHQNNVSLEYVLHRWYNYQTSIYCEKVFVQNGAKKEKDKKNKEIDLYINNVPFDVKLTVYPKKLADHPYDLRTRDGKNALIKWLYQNQSQQNRKHLKNRIFIVCDGKTAYDSLCLKSDFEKINAKIKEYMDYIKEFGFNEVSILDEGFEYLVMSDIIYIN